MALNRQILLSAASFLTMSVISRRWLYLLAGFGCALNGCERAPLTVGGRAAIEAVKSIEVDLHIVDPDFEVDGKYRAARPGRMRIDVMANGKHVYTEALDWDRGWQWKGKGSVIEEESPKATAALRHGVELPGKLVGLHELRQRGHRVDLGGREAIEGTDYYALRITLRDGYTTTLYVDPTPTTIESCFSDFRNVDGVLFAFFSTDTDLATGKILETTRVRSIKANPRFDPVIFSAL
jgi:hypothetical protein